jgi:hypothetical protein
MQALCLVMYDFTSTAWKVFLILEHVMESNCSVIFEGVLYCMTSGG